MLKKILIFVILISLTFLFSACFFQTGREMPILILRSLQNPVPSADAEKPSQIQQPSPNRLPCPRLLQKPAPTEEERFKEILGG